MIQNIGMGSKLYKYLYHNKILSKLNKSPSNEEEIKQFKEFVYNKYGLHGAI